MNSPDSEVAGFTPSISSIAEEGYSTTAKGIRAARTVSKIKIKDKDIDEVQKIYHCLSSNLINVVNRILSSTINTTIKEPTNCEENSSLDKIIEANDTVLDALNLQIGPLTTMYSEPPKDCTGKSSTSVGTVSSWNTQPTILMAKQPQAQQQQKAIRRPQLQFMKPVDNSDSIFVPKIQDKPNAKKQLALTILYDKEGMEIGYEHPYLPELQVYRPPKSFLKDDLHLLPFPEPLQNQDYTFVQDEAQLDLLISDLSAVNEIAVDLEHHSQRSYLGLTCLIQISTQLRDYIIDALALRDHLHKLNLIFSDPSKLKILHGASQDVLWLQRDFGVYIVGMYDTYIAAKLLRLPQLSLQFLLKHYCKVHTDKSYQLADWRQRPLTEPMIQYARTDTHYLTYIWRATKRDFFQRGCGTDNVIRVFEESTQICMQTYNKNKVDEDSYIKLQSSFNKILDSRQSECFKRLYFWRDRIAREEDESPDFVLHKYCIIQFAEKMPKEKEGIEACCGGRMPTVLKQRVDEVLQIIKECHALPIEKSRSQMPQRFAAALNIEVKLNIEMDDTKHLDFGEETPTVKNQVIQYNNAINECRPEALLITQSTPAHDPYTFSSPYERLGNHIKLAEIRELQISDSEASETPRKPEVIPTGSAIIGIVSKGNNISSIKVEISSEEDDSESSTDGIQFKGNNVSSVKVERSSGADNSEPFTDGIQFKGNNISSVKVKRSSGEDCRQSFTDGIQFKGNNVSSVKVERSSGADNSEPFTDGIQFKGNNISSVKVKRSSGEDCRQSFTDGIQFKGNNVSSVKVERSSGADNSESFTDGIPFKGNKISSVKVERSSGGDNSESLNDGMPCKRTKISSVKVERSSSEDNS